jgi:hypothetical protein
LLSSSHAKRIGHARHLFLHFDASQLAVAIDVGLLANCCFEAAPGARFALRAHALVIRRDFGAHDVTVAVGIERGEIRRRRAASFARARSGCCAAIAPRARAPGVELGCG